MIIGLAIGIAIAWFAACARLHILNQWHHEYIGVALVALPWLPAKIAGLIVMADDAGQHLAQLWHPTYLSPLHRLWDAVAMAWAAR